MAEQEGRENAAVEDDNVWRSCCTYIDSRVLQFIVQSLMCWLVCMFCMFMLFHSVACPEQQLYSGILTMVLGVFIPNPKMH